MIMRYKLVLLVLLLSHLGYGQSLYAEFGQSVTSFDYQNSIGGTIENLQNATTSYLGAGYAFQLPGDNAYVEVGGLFANYKAIGSDAVLDNYFEWDVTYVGLQTGVSYQFARTREFRFYAKLSASLEYLLRGSQTVNTQVFNLSGEDEFDSFIITPRMALGVQYPISNKAALYLQYQYGRSFSLVKANPNDNEKLNINSHNIGIGIVIQLPGCNCAFNNY
jgi:hypothetical protein